MDQPEKQEIEIKVTEEAEHFVVKTVLGRRQRPHYDLQPKEQAGQPEAPRKKVKEMPKVVQYCVEREDGRKTWEDERILEKSQDVKDLIAEYMRALDYRKNAPLKKLRKLRARQKDCKGH